MSDFDIWAGLRKEPNDVHADVVDKPENCYDGRCFALDSARGPDGYHHRCSVTGLAPNKLFCVHHEQYSLRPRGTVWQHKIGCPECNARCKLHDAFPPQPFDVLPRSAMRFSASEEVVDIATLSQNTPDNSTISDSNNKRSGSTGGKRPSQSNHTASLTSSSTSTSYDNKSTNGTSHLETTGDDSHKARRSKKRSEWSANVHNDPNQSSSIPNTFVPSNGSHTASASSVQSSAVTCTSIATSSTQVWHNNVEATETDQQLSIQNNNMKTESHHSNGVGDLGDFHMGVSSYDIGFDTNTSEFDGVAPSIDAHRARSHSEELFGSMTIPATSQAHQNIMDFTETSISTTNDISATSSVSHGIQNRERMITSHGFTSDGDFPLSYETNKETCNSSDVVSTAVNFISVADAAENKHTLDSSDHGIRAIVSVPNCITPARLQRSTKFTSVLQRQLREPVVKSSPPTDTSDENGRFNSNALVSAPGVSDVTSFLQNVVQVVCGIDLAAAPVEGDSWLSNTIIDFIIWKLAQEYQNVHFLSCDFLAYELPKQYSGYSGSYVPRDLLNRPVKLEPYVNIVTPIVAKKEMDQISKSGTSKITQNKMFAHHPLRHVQLHDGITSQSTQLIRSEHYLKTIDSNGFSYRAPLDASNRCPSRASTGSFISMDRSPSRFGQSLPGSTHAKLSSKSNIKQSRRNVSSWSVPHGNHGGRTNKPTSSSNAVRRLAMDPDGYSIHPYTPTFGSSKPTNEFMEVPDVRSCSAPTVPGDAGEHSITSTDTKQKNRFSIEDYYRFSGLHIRLKRQRLASQPSYQVARWSVVECFVYLPQFRIQRPVSWAAGSSIPHYIDDGTAYLGAPEASAHHLNGTLPHGIQQNVSRTFQKHKTNSVTSFHSASTLKRQDMTASSKYGRNSNRLNNTKSDSQFLTSETDNDVLDMFRARLQHPTPHYADRSHGHQYTLRASYRSKPLIFFSNVGNNHWNLFRVVFEPTPEIQLFEPLGKPVGRARDGLSVRAVPRSLLLWLDATCPIGIGWQKVAVSAIRERQQQTGFDCGVACLVYAEKCAQGQSKLDIQATTTQSEISAYRSLLQQYFDHLRLSGSNALYNPSAEPSCHENTDRDNGIAAPVAIGDSNFTGAWSTSDGHLKHSDDLGIGSHATGTTGDSLVDSVSLFDSKFFEKDDFTFLDVDEDALWSNHAGSLADLDVDTHLLLGDSSVSFDVPESSVETTTAESLISGTNNTECSSAASGASAAVSCIEASLDNSTGTFNDAS